MVWRYQLGQHRPLHLPHVSICTLQEHKWFNLRIFRAFGAFLLIASVYVKLLISLFGFFETYLGRGIFLFFMASLCFSGWPHWTMIITGAVFVFSAVVHFVITFTVDKVSLAKVSKCKNVGIESPWRCYWRHDWRISYLWLSEVNEFLNKIFWIHTAQLQCLNNQHAFMQPLNNVVGSVVDVQRHVEDA